MIEKVTLRVIAVLAVICLSACIKQTDSFQVKIEVSDDVINISKDGGSGSFTVKANSPWTISSESTDCSLSVSSGEANKTVKVIVTVPANTAPSDRSYMLTITAKDESKYVSVIQPFIAAPNVSELEISSFGISPNNNERIYIPIDFISKNGSKYIFQGNQEIKYYKTDITALKAFFNSNATKVTVGSVKQVSGLTANDFTNEVIYHFYTADNDYVEYKVKITNPANSYSGLPILVLTTDDGTDIKSKDDWQKGYFKFDPQGNAEMAELNGITEIRGRGNSTWGMPKKPYALKLDQKSDGTFGGMKPHKRWAILANYADKTGIRNRVAFEIGKRSKLGWTPDSRYAEVILNGKFLGNYLITEQIKIDKNRVNIAEIKNTETNSEQVTGGWLMELDRYYSMGETRYFRPTISQSPIIVKDPEDANPTQMAYIQKYFDDAEKRIFPNMPSGLPYHAGNAHLAGEPDSLQYHQYIDITSFIDYWIVQEVVGNRDGRLPGSVYMYKGVNGKLCAGPLWDFDQTTFLGDQLWMYYDYVPSNTEYNEPLNMRTLWYSQLFKDPKFKNKAKQRWNELYPYLRDGVPAFIDQEYTKIAKSLEINWVDIDEDESQGIWGLSDSEKENGGRNRDKNLSSAEAVQKMKTRYFNRLNWINSQIMSW